MGKRSVAAHTLNDWKQYNIVDTITPSICAAYLQVGSCAPHSQYTQYVHNSFAAQRLNLSIKGHSWLRRQSQRAAVLPKVDNILPTTPNLLSALYCTPTVLQLFSNCSPTVLQAFSFSQHKHTTFSIAKSHQMFHSS